MIVQEPVQAAIWHCLNHYDYNNAVFLSERLYAEVQSDDTLFLLATAYYRTGQKDHAFHILKDKTDVSTQCRYLLAICAFDLEKYAEAEAALLQKNETDVSTLDDVAAEYGEQASLALSLLGNIAAKTERNSRAIDAWKRALKLNPFLWSNFENLCKIGDKPNPQSIFQISDLQNLSMNQGTNLNNVESVIITNSTPNTDNQDALVATPQQILVNFNTNNTSSKLCTPDESPVCSQPLWFSGMVPFSRGRALRMRFDSATSPQPTFGQFADPSDTYAGTPNLLAQPKLTESNSHHQSLAKRMKAQVDQFINRKEPIIQNCKPLFSQSTNVSKTPTITLNQPNQNVRRSSRLFSSSYSVKENNKSPNRNKFVTPKSPTRKTKRLPKCNLNKTSYATTPGELNNTRNRIEKEKTETITTIAAATIIDNAKLDKSAIINNNSIENCVQQALNMQKQSAEGLMCLLRAIGQAYVDFSTFNCKNAIDQLNTLPPNQFQTAWVYSLLGLCHFELAEYDACTKYFGNVHNMEPYRIQNMDIYSTALWHLQKEVTLSALAQDLVALNKASPVTWCVNGNCFSLHKEHDTAIKFFQRAVQVDPGFPYAYTLLGHEFITTEELDKAMSCFRNAVRLDSRHYNAWFGIGNIYAKQERYQLAEINYNRALSINTQSAVILCHIAIVQHALKNSEQALKTLNRAIANNPKSPLCKFHRGSINCALDRHEEALKELQELKEIVPKESLVYYLIGRVHKKLGNTDLALMHINWATDLDPKGASSQIKEAFDPSIRVNSTVAESPMSPPDVGGSREMQPARLSFGNLPEDSEDSF